MDLPRSSGILLHITSLPSRYGIGDLGPGAYAFADYLVSAHQHVWQILPVVPVGHGYSPYSSPSTFAGNPLMISPDLLHEAGLLSDDDIADVPDFPRHFVDYDHVLPYKRRLLERAFERFEAGAWASQVPAFETFCEAQAGWLSDYALFMAVKEAFGHVAWTEWPASLVRREPEALDAARREYARTIRMHAFWQFLFDRQWRALHSYCRARSIRLFGDLPIYVAHDSADVWAHPELFFLDQEGRPTVVAGVPPDYFSETGQRWGNPLYRWDVMERNDFVWWTRRLEHVLTLFDLVRLDHFRGFAGYWEVPAEEETAVNGRWVPGPGTRFFERLEAKLGRLPLVAENLGIITDDVTELMNRFGFPGMAVLQFAFDSDTDSDYLPHNFIRNLIAYTGTHDNDTLVGWWMNAQGTRDPDAVERTRSFARLYLDLEDERQLPWRCIRALMASVANLVVFPMQDVLGLGSRARMNTPGRSGNNWAWRCLPEQLTGDTAQRLRLLTQLYGRSREKHVPVHAST